VAELAAGRLAVLESAEQVGSKVRYKLPKSGKGRTLALFASVVGEWAHRARQAEELLKVGIRLSDETFVVAQADGHTVAARLDHARQGQQIGTTLPCPAFVSTIYGMPTQHICLATECIRRSPASGSGIPESG